jgi:hypothetical protein
MRVCARRCGFLRHRSGERYNHLARGKLTIPVVDLSRQPRAGAMCALASLRRNVTFPTAAIEI